MEEKKKQSNKTFKTSKNFIPKYFLQTPAFLISWRFFTSCCLFITVAVQNMQQISLSISIISMVNGTAVRPSVEKSFIYSHNQTCSLTQLAANTNNQVISNR
jgi:hypothetical protein